MTKGLILSQADVKKIIADHFNVSEDKVLQSKYSYVVVQDENKTTEKE